MTRQESIRRPNPLCLVPYREFRECAVTGMIGLTYGTDPIARLIQTATNSDYSHALMIGWGAPDVLCLAESREPHAQVIGLSHRVLLRSHLIDVYRLLVPFDEHRAWAFMLRLSGTDYPESWIVDDWLRIQFGDVVPPVPNSDDPERPRHCSGALSAAFRIAGVPAIKDHDSDVWPCSFALPSVSEYVCTPIWK